MKIACREERVKEQVCKSCQTKATKKRMPGKKNLNGIENFVKYVKLRARMEINRKPPIIVSPDAKAL